MQQYEQELEKKTNHISEMQLEQTQMVQENTNLSHQLYVLKTKFNEGDSNPLMTNDEEKIEKIQKD